MRKIRNCYRDPRRVRETARQWAARFGIPDLDRLWREAIRSCP